MNDGPFSKTKQDSDPLSCCGKQDRKLCSLDGAGRAHIRARTAVLAFGSIDHIQSTDLCNRAFRTFGFTGTALDAIIGNYIRHGKNPFLLTSAGIEIGPIYKG